ncbi:MAG: ABC transporter ATP-binding protein [Deltaproteobacteria bacterium]|nr:ABC transporter ATP-binding protein [Deltaproteobacteria bacterium]
MATVLLKGLTKQFGELPAVKGLHLEIHHGEFVSLLGPSGCGKTTTLRLIAGFLQPEEGEIRVDQNVLSSQYVLVPPERRNMSMIFQSYAVWPHMTVFQNVAYGLKLKKLSREEIGKKVERLLRLVHLETLEGRYPAELSGGQQQRVALARALVVEPQILLLDEPLSNLDANLREEMRFEIRRLHEEFRITTIYVTHDQAEAMVTSDRIAIMNQGRIIQVGTPEEVYDRPKTRFVAEFVGKTNILPGRLEESGRVSLAAGQKLRVAAQDGTGKGAGVSVCIRPHNIILSGGAPESSMASEGAYNVFSGTVTRRIYFGDAIDYTVELSNEPVSLRVVTPASQRHDPGTKVFALVHADHCVIVGEA